MSIDNSNDNQIENIANQVDDAGLETDQNIDNDIQVPFNPSEIDVVVSRMTLDMLHKRLQHGELNLTPDFQRKANVWDDKRKSRLIESVLLRIPLPSFYLSEDHENNYAVVDGLQRLCAIFHFMDVNILNNTTNSKLSTLKLKGLQYLTDLEGKTFKSLDRKFQRRIEELEITANVIRSSTPIAVKFNVFARLNQGGMPLVAQEIRNAIFPGPWRGHIREMATNITFLSATENKISKDRQQDMEMVLRFVALVSLGNDHKRVKDQTLDDFLNETVEKRLASWTDGNWIYVKNKFELCIKSAKLIFGIHAFRKYYGPNFSRNPINRGLFESQLVMLYSLNDEVIKKLIANKEKVMKIYAQNMNHNSHFVSSLLYATGSSNSTNIRTYTFKNIFEESIK